MKHWLIMVMASVWCGVYNIYYGWHKFPQSEPELICYGILLILITISLHSWSRK